MHEKSGSVKAIQSFKDTLVNPEKQKREKRLECGDLYFHFCSFILKGFRCIFISLGHLFNSIIIARNNYVSQFSA